MGKRACLVLLSEKEYADHHAEDQPVLCELHPDDRKSGARYQAVKINGLTSRWARKNNILSGVTTLFAESSLIDDSTNELLIPSHSTIKVVHTVNAFYEWLIGKN